MNDAFVRKKVESLTLGEKLKKLRSQYRMSLTEVSRATRIQVKYLEYLESGEYGKLPAEVYTKGFLKNYARHLGLDEEALLKLYDKEKNIQANLGQESVFDHRPRLPLMSTFVLTSRTVVLSLIVLLVTGTFFYLFREFRSFVIEPALIVYEPASGAVVGESVVTVRGKSDRGAEVFVNDQGVFVTDEGNFSESVVLRPGVNTVTVKARNRFEKEKVETISFEARITPLPSTDIETAREKFMLIITGRDEGGTINVEADGEIVYSGELGDGAEQTVTATREITISSTRGENIWVSFRGEESEMLSKSTPGPIEARFTSKGREE